VPLRLRAPTLTRGEFRPVSADPEIVALQESYVASGCADDEVADCSDCREHPYRLRIDEERSR
jgi:hypothetical protein